MFRPHSPHRAPVSAPPNNVSISWQLVTVAASHGSHCIWEGGTSRIGTRPLIRCAISNQKTTTARAGVDQIPSGRCCIITRDYWLWRMSCCACGVQAQQQNLRTGHIPLTLDGSRSGGPEGASEEAHRKEKNAIDVTSTQISACGAKCRKTPPQKISLFGLTHGAILPHIHAFTAGRECLASSSARSYIIGL